MAFVDSVFQILDPIFRSRHEATWNDFILKTTQTWALTKQCRSDVTFLTTLCLALLVVYSGLREKADPYAYKLFERPQRSGGDATPVRSRNVAQRLTESQSDAVIFWGSQSGTAEALARRLTSELKRNLQVKACLIDLSDIDPETLAQIPSGSVVIFIVSTYGNGDPSDNASEFMDFITTNQAAIRPLRYAILGLGNSNYQHYNKIADTIACRLRILTSTPPLLVKRADEANLSTEEDYLEWKDGLMRILTQELNLVDRRYKYEPAIRIENIEGSEFSDLETGEPLVSKAKRGMASAKAPVVQLPIKYSVNLTPKRVDGAMCVHIDLDLSSHTLVRYKTGDYLAVWPSNPDQEVTRLLTQLSIMHDHDRQIFISKMDANDSDLALPSATTIGALFKYYLQVCAPVSREVISALCHFAPTGDTRSFLQRLTDKENYRQFMDGKYFTLADLLEQSSGGNSEWSCLPLTFVVESLPAMTSRRYSISSSSVVAPKQISLTVAVKPATLQGTNTVIPGLATSYLVAASGTTGSGPPSRLVPCQVLRSQFKLPFKSETPVILVAAGSGIAPFRGFIHERARLCSMGRSVGRTILIFGCRHPEQDDLYCQGDLDKLATGVLKGNLDIVKAYSQIEGLSKCYVQDKLAETKTQKMVARLLLKDNASIYFCGSTAMAKAAGKSVVLGLQRENGMSGEAAWQWVDKQKQFKKWQEDVWG